MGQRSGPASELIFEDCFVPTERIIADPSEFPSLSETARDKLEFSLGFSRIAVGAWSVGTARGALERAVTLAAETDSGGQPLIKRQWCQSILSDMLLNVTAARAVYLEAQYAAMLALSGRARQVSMPDFIGRSPFTHINAWGFKNLGIRKLIESRPARFLLARQMKGHSPEANARLQFMSSMAKVAGSDAAMRNCHLAVEMMGRAGLRHDRGLEKVFRDAKLLQIFEGTNQLNRLNAFSNFFARHLPGVDVFETGEKS
jgi:alkylation response protein AidB-like acyl-CoA dehydrogenase